MKPSIQEFKRIDGKACINGIRANARIRVEQNADKVLKILKIKTLAQLNGDMLLTTDRRFKHYKANEDRNILKMDCSSGNTTEKLVVSNTTNFPYQNS